MVNRIRELLDARQLSPTQFADLIGVGRPVMSHILSERNKPSLEVVQKILDAFPDVSLAWLMKGTGAMQVETTPAQAAAPALASTPVPPPPVSPVRSEPAVNAAAMPASVPIGTVAPATTLSSYPQVFTASPVAPASSANAAVPAPRPMPPRFRAGRTQAAAAPTIVATAPLAAASVVASALPPAANPAPVASSAVAPVFEAAPSLTLAPVPVAYASPGPPDAATGYQPTAPAFAPAPTVASQAAPVAPAVASALPAAEAPAIAGSTPATTVAEASIAEAAPVAAPNPAAALSFLGEPGKAIRRIVIFYRDGSFSDYVPEGY